MTCEDRRAHERIDTVEKTVIDHIKEHSKFEKALAENVRMTTETAKNTAELVANTTELIAIFKGAKGFRAFIMWVWPYVAGGAAVWAWIKTH